MRLKVIAGNLAVVLLLGLTAYLAVGSRLRGDLLGRIDNQLGSDRVLFERSYRLLALELVDLVSDRANERQVRDVFGGLDVDSRRTRAYEAAEAVAAWLADPARGERGGPDIVVIVDETGKAIARNGARNVLFGKLLVPELPALGKALQSGQAMHDVWHEAQENKFWETAIAPIRTDSGAVLGALVVGYDLSNGMAQREGALLTRDIAFVVEGNVYSSSLSVGAARDLRAELFGPQAEATRRVLSGQGALGQRWRVPLDGNDYIGVVARLPLAPSVPVAYAVLGNRTAQLAVASVVNVILILTVLGIALVVLYGFIIGGNTMRAVEEIEEGILAVINGRTDVRLDTEGTELGGLAFRINQLINVLTGTEEATEGAEGRTSVAPRAAAWKDAAFAESGSSEQATQQAATATNPDEPIEDPALAARLAAEDEPAYQARVYAEYVAAKRALGEDVANIPQDRFHQRLAGRASALAQKHGCRSVRFQVETSGNQVVLRPVLLR